MTNQRRTSFVVLVPLLAVFVALAASEWALRSFAPLYTVGIQSTYQYDPELGYRLAPSVHRYQLTDHLEEIRTNGLGTVNFQEKFDRYPVLVFAAGDSYTQGTGNSSDTSYPFQLDLLLNQDDRGFYQERYGVVNLGLAAFGTEQSLIALKRYADLIGKPRYVLYLGCDNDWEDDVLLRSGYRHRHLVAGSPLWGRFVGPMLWLSQFELVKRAKFAYSQLQRARKMNQAAPGGGADAAAPSTAERVWPTIERIVALSREWNAVLVLGWANPDGDSYAWLKAKAAEEHIPFADWNPPMESVRERMPDLPMANPHSGGHWRPWTNNVIARTYARAMGVWPASAAEPAPGARDVAPVSVPH
jgi:hypothetical protein